MNLTTQQTQEVNPSILPKEKRKSIAFIQGVMDAHHFSTGEGKHHSFLNRYKPNTLESDEYQEGLTANESFLDNQNFKTEATGN